MELTVDLFIKTYSADLPWLAYCLRSVEKFAHGFRRLVLVVDTPEERQKVFELLFAPTQQERRLIGMQPQICTGPLCPVAKVHGHAAGYWWQMGVKLSWMDYTDADAVVITDSDCLFTREVTPGTWHHEGRPLWFTRPWEEAGAARTWRHSADHFLGFPSPFETMCRNGFILTRPATVGFLDFMRRRFQQSPMEYVIDPRHGKPEEYEMFGSYLAAVDPHGYAVIPWQTVPDWPLCQFWSWGGISSSVRDEMEKILR